MDQSYSRDMRGYGRAPPDPEWPGGAAIAVQFVINYEEGSEAGWEIASHGLKWIEYKDFSKEAERKHMREAIEIHTDVTGSRPLGWYTGRCTMHTLDLVAEDGCFASSADSYADDLPYRQDTESGEQLIVPFTLDANDLRFATPQGFNAGEQFLAYLRDSFDLLYAEGRAGAPKMLSVGLHCRLAGRAAAS